MVYAEEKTGGREVSRNSSRRKQQSGPPLRFKQTSHEAEARRVPLVSCRAVALV